MTFKIQSIASTVQDSLHKGRAWARMKLAERARAVQHYDGTAAETPRGYLLGTLVSLR